MNIVTWPYVLRKGHSDNPAEGACAMAAISWLVHGIHSDAPPCASPAIVKFVIPANDAMDDRQRQRFLPYLHRIAGSRSPEHEAARGRIMVLGALRIFAPRALDAAGLRDYAAKLRGLPDDVDMKQVAGVVRSAWVAKAAVARVAVARVAGAWAAEAAAAATSDVWRDAVAAAARAAREATKGGAWDDYFAVLDEALSAGPQGEPWSADVVDAGTALYRAANGLVKVA